MNKKNTAPRTQPKQPRSLLTRESILGAFSQLVSEFGYANTSTNRIADRAGISIGTLYHHFPNCESIAVALYEQTCSQAALDMRKMMVDSLDVPLEQTVPSVLKAILKIHQDHKSVLLDLVDEAEPLKEISHVLSFDSLVRGSLRTFLDQHSMELQIGEVDTTLFMVRNTIMGNIRRFIMESPSHIDSAAFVDELARVVISYLRNRQDVGI